MSEVLIKLNEAIKLNVKPATFPVAVKMATEGEEIGQRAKRPGTGFENQYLAVHKSPSVP